jgi:hypothetical protein
MFQGGRILLVYPFVNVGDKGKRFHTTDNPFSELINITFFITIVKCNLKDEGGLLQYFVQNIISQLMPNDIVGL